MEVVDLKPRTARVLRVYEESPDTKTYYLELTSLDPSLFKPGRYVMVYVWGFGEIPISLSDIVVGDHRLYVGLTIKSVGVVTRYIYEHVEPGDILGIRGPYGNDWGVENYRGWNILVIAGGIGLAPLRPLIKHVLSNRGEYGSLKILFGARNPEQIIYRDELRKWSRAFDTEVYLTIDKPVEGWSGYTGFVTDLIDHVDIDDKTVAFICGPEIMMKKSVEKLVSRGLDPDHIYLSLERRMRCGVGVCGTCQFGHYLVCRDGPVFRYSDIARYLWVDGV